MKKKNNEQSNNTLESTKKERSFVDNVKDLKDLIAPSGIDATSTNKLEIVSATSKYARTMLVSTLPRMCTFPQLLRGMYTFGDINVSVYITPISEAKSQNELNRVIYEV